jgi:hypothetical protein
MKRKTNSEMELARQMRSTLNRLKCDLEYANTEFMLLAVCLSVCLFVCYFFYFDSGDQEKFPKRQKDHKIIIITIQMIIIIEDKKAL